jgi:nucleoid-associated protein YgaU
MHKIIYIFIGVLMLSLAGCVSVNKVVRERVDQDASGNRGYLQGSGAEKTAEVTPEKREYIDVKLELPTLKEIKENLPKAKAKQKEQTTDKASEGNEGFVEKGEELEEELPPISKEEATQPVYEEAEETASEMAQPQTAPRTYIVKAGDSLSKISKELYGKASKWTVIYEANADKIKDPNSIREGIVLTIPALEEAESQYAK